MTVGINEYSLSEKTKLVELREKVSDLQLSDYQQHDSYLIRWLRARNLDVKKAEEMLRFSIAWRKANGVDGIIEREDTPEELKKETPIALCGTNKEGYPIILCPLGRQDARKALETYGKERCHRFNIINMEKITRLLDLESERQGKPVTQFVEIMDFEGYSYKQMSSKLCREFMIEFQRIMDSHYPEILRYGVIVNAPKIFAILFAMLKPFIPKHTLEKIDIYGPDREKWMKVISEKFPLECIPPYWGGTMKGVDEFCSGSTIWIQGPTDMRPYMNGCSEKDAEFTKIIINARDKFAKEFTIEEKNTVIEWEFKTENNDVGFDICVNAAGQENEIEDIVPYKRVDAHDKVQQGSHICEVVGKYTFTFDNSFSLMKSKTLLYRISVIDPDSDFQECPEF